ncbi:hypothetical protein FOCG_08530 [Fusarium oxysporum f. sp. radicis-lycopersici 26381]|nr:hypothetical protein FOCG_08530 [Fusarium oxysporum f. sp. radicis-lycopersici 26381]
MWGPCVEVGAPKDLESRAAEGCWCCSGSQSCRGRSYGRKSRAQSPDCRRLAKPECRRKKKPQITREK